MRAQYFILIMQGLAGKPVFCPYPKIGQFRNAIRTVQKMTDGLGSIPILKFSGTVKLHGTNAGICYSDSLSKRMWSQSRKRLITTEKDNIGFAKYVEQNHKFIMEMIEAMAYDFKIDLKQNIICIYGEWCGQRIQKNVAICNLPKMFVIFGCRIVPLDQIRTDDDIDVDEDSLWIDISRPLIQKIHEDNFTKRCSYAPIRIFNIYDFPTYEVTIDFSSTATENSVLDAQKRVVQITTDVENECPVAKYFGIMKTESDSKTCTTGEGVVWTSFFNGRRIAFKVKGSEHEVVKTSQMASINVEAINGVKEFLGYAITEQRFKQGIEVLFTSTGETPTVKEIGSFVNWIKGDIFREEMDTLTENGLKPGNVAREISNMARKWFNEYLDSLILNSKSDA